MKPLSLSALSILVAVAAYSAETLKPQIGEPLRHAAVTRGPDGTWYLTGTRAKIKYFTMDEEQPSVGPDGKPDFFSNNGVKLWSSRDLKTWKDEGLVYDLMTRSKWCDYLTQFYALPERPLGSKNVRGITSPRLSFIDGTCLITVSSCGQDVRWLKGAQPAGPYDDGRVSYKKNHYSDPLTQSNGPGDGELFRDEDGTVYLIRGPGYLAQVNPDLQEIDYATRQFLLTHVEGYPAAAWCAGQFDPHGASLFLHNGKYILTWGAFTDDAGYKRDDTFYAVADQLEGPYSEPKRLIAGGGPAVLFDGGDHGVMASCSIDDAPVLIPVSVRDGKLTAPSAAAAVANAKPILPGRPNMYDYAHSKPSGKWSEVVEKTGRANLVPLFDMPLADVSICRGGDGVWYMTGTAASRRKTEERGRRDHPTPDTRHVSADFQNNDGIYLWRSEDLNTWTPLGKVWDIDTSTSLSAGSAGGDWQKQYRIPGNNPVRDDFCRGVTSPEIHFMDNTYWIAYSMNGRGTGLLKSETGKPEGPYRDMGRVTAMGEAPSLFDDDGRTYWLWGKGLRMAPLAMDKARIDGPAVDLFLKEVPYKGRVWGSTTDTWRPTGPHLFKARDPQSNKDKYYLSFSGISQTYERANRDALIMMADSIEGPYLGHLRMAPNGGQTTVFRGPDNELYATFSGADPSAVWRNKPSLFPLEWFKWAGLIWPRRYAFNHYTDRGPWAEMTTPEGLEGTQLRDMTVLDAPDGYFYFSGSVTHEDGVGFWKARDLKGPWEDMGLVYTWEDMRDDPDWPEIKDKKDMGWNKRRGAWEQSMEYAQGTYWASGWFGGPGWGKDKVWKKFIGVLLRSKTGKPEGPYEFHSEWQTDYQGLFIDDDKTIYGIGGAYSIWRMTEDLKGIDVEWAQSLEPKPWLRIKKDGSVHIFLSDEGKLTSNDCGYQLYRMGDWYVFSGLGGNASYDMCFFVSKNITGPYRFIGVVPRMGNSQIAQNRDGKWLVIFPQCKAAQFSRVLGDVNNAGDGLPAPYEVTLDMDSDNPSIWPTHDLGHLNKAIYQEVYE